MTMKFTPLAVKLLASLLISLLAVANASHADHSAGKAKEAFRLEDSTYLSKEAGKNRAAPVKQAETPGRPLSLVHTWRASASLRKMVMQLGQQGANSSTSAELTGRRKLGSTYSPSTAVSQAWHNIIIAKYYVRHSRTKCFSQLGSAASSLTAGRKYILRGSLAAAIQQITSARTAAQSCSNSLRGASSNRVAAQYIGLATRLMEGASGALTRHLKLSSGGGSPGAAPGGNPLDSCWIGNRNWMSDRQHLASCVQGFGAGANGGRGGRVYTVTTSEDNPSSPRYGSLRWGVIQPEPLWIVFSTNMAFKLLAELVVSGRKTLDGRGANIVFQGGCCFAMEFVSDIIIHNLHFVNCQHSTRQMVRIRPDFLQLREQSRGDSIIMYTSSRIWIDHCLFDTAIGLANQGKHIDVTHTATDITISNNYFRNQDKVILMGHDDSYTADVNMRVTLMLNVFGENLNQRLPRGRFGKFHVLNNYYPHGWGIYAIGGSCSPTFRSEGNFFVANNNPFTKEVTGHMGATSAAYKSWSWRSVGDHFANGAKFTQTGEAWQAPYAYKAIPALSVPAATSQAGPLTCTRGAICRH